MIITAMVPSSIILIVCIALTLPVDAFVRLSDFDRLFPGRRIREAPSMPNSHPAKKIQLTREDVINLEKQANYLDEFLGRPQATEPPQASLRVRNRVDQMRRTLRFLGKSLLGVIGGVENSLDVSLGYHWDENALVVRRIPSQDAGVPVSTTRLPQVDMSSGEEEEEEKHQTRTTLEPTTSSTTEDIGVPVLTLEFATRRAKRKFENTGDELNFQLQVYDSLRRSGRLSPCGEDYTGWCLNGGGCLLLRPHEGIEMNLCRCRRGYTGQRCHLSDAVWDQHVSSYKRQIKQIFQHA